MRKTSYVDVVADARKLPFKNGCFDHVFSSHLIEHFSHRDVQNVLSEWIRVLDLGGTLEIKCPDLRIRAVFYALDPSWKNIQNIYGEQDYVGNQHLCGFCFGSLKSLLEANGISNVKRVLDGFKGIPFLPNCLHVQGKKEKNS